MDALPPDLQLSNPIQTPLRRGSSENAKGRPSGRPFHCQPLWRRLLCATALQGGRHAHKMRPERRWTMRHLTTSFHDVETRREDRALSRVRQPATGCIGSAALPVVRGDRVGKAPGCSPYAANGSTGMGRCGPFPQSATQRSRSLWKGHILCGEGCEAGARVEFFANCTRDDS